MNQNNFQRGDKVIITTREDKMLTGTYSHHCPNGKAYIKAEDGKAYEREYKSIKKVGQADTDFSVSSTNLESMSITPPKTPDWDINQRFDFLQQLVRMVLNETAVSLIITGEGGLGKTFTVKREIRRKNMSNFDDFVYIKGFSTPRGLYRTLFENNGKLIVFDDCDEVLDDKIAVGLLKGALDSYDERTIHWITKSMDESLPDSFTFTGRVIFISNKSQNRIDQAILSRSMCIDLTMSREDKLRRMRYIVDSSRDFMPTIPMNVKEEAFRIIEENLDNVKELSLRSLEKVLRIRVGEIEDNKQEYDDEDGKVTTDWKTLAKYMLVN